MVARSASSDGKLCTRVPPSETPVVTLLCAAGEHAQEDVGARPVFQPVVDRPHLQVHALETMEGAFDPAQAFVSAYGRTVVQGFGVQGFGGQAGAHRLETVETGFLGDRLGVAVEREAGVADLGSSARLNRHPYSLVCDPSAIRLRRVKRSRHQRGCRCQIGCVITPSLLSGEMCALL